MTPEPVPIYTIGYGSRTWEAFLDALQTHAVAYLIDVRSTPYSSFKPEFSRKELDNRLRVHGVRYLYLGEALGGQPADRDCYEADKVIYERVMAKPFFQEGLSRVRAAFEQQLRVVLMCSEERPEACHRSKLIGVALEKLGITVEHIDENGELLSQADVMAKVTGGQLNLFEDPTFTSRKKYRPSSRDAGQDHEPD